MKADPSLAASDPSGMRALAPSGSASPDDPGAAALQFLTQLAAEANSGTVDLPCFPNIVFRIRTALADPENTPEKTVSIIGAEPRLSARLLQTANSVTFNRSGKRVTDLRTAILRLGHHMVNSMVMAFAIQHMKAQESLRSIAEPLGELWIQSISAALICQLLARNTPVSSDEAFLAGLMHGMGRLYIMVRTIGEAADYGRDERSMNSINASQASIGKTVLQNWNFAPEICKAVAEQQDYARPLQAVPELTDVLIAGLVVAAALTTPPPRAVDMAGIVAFQTLRLNAEKCAVVLDTAELQIGSLMDALSC